MFLRVVIKNNNLCNVSVHLRRWEYLVYSNYDTDLEYDKTIKLYSNNIAYTYINNYNPLKVNWK